MVGCIFPLASSWPCRSRNLLGRSRSALLQFMAFGEPLEPFDLEPLDDHPIIPFQLTAIAHLLHAVKTGRVQTVEDNFFALNMHVESIA